MTRSQVPRGIKHKTICPGLNGKQCGRTFWAFSEGASINPRNHCTVCIPPREQKGEN